MSAAFCRFCLRKAQFGACHHDSWRWQTMSDGDILANSQLRLLRVPWLHYAQIVNLERRPWRIETIFFGFFFQPPAPRMLRESRPGVEEATFPLLFACLLHPQRRSLALFLKQKPCDILYESITSPQTLKIQQLVARTNLCAAVSESQIVPLPKAKKKKSYFCASITAWELARMGCG